VLQWRIQKIVLGAKLVWELCPRGGAGGKAPAKGPGGKAPRCCGINAFFVVVKAFS